MMLQPYRGIILCHSLSFLNSSISFKYFIAFVTEVHSELENNILNHFLFTFLNDIFLYNQTDSHTKKIATGNDIAQNANGSSVIICGLQKKVLWEE